MWSGYDAICGVSEFASQGFQRTFPELAGKVQTIENILPKELIQANEDKAIRIPMSEETRLRSFNLSNSANIILFEALRQLDFPNLR